MDERFVHVDDAVHGFYKILDQVFCYGLFIKRRQILCHQITERIVYSSPDTLTFCTLTEIYNQTVKSDGNILSLFPSSRDYGLDHPVSSILHTQVVNHFGFLQLLYRLRHEFSYHSRFQVAILMFPCTFFQPFFTEPCEIFFHFLCKLLLDVFFFEVAEVLSEPA